MSSSPPLPKRIDDPQSLVDRHPVLHVLRPQTVALREQGGSRDERIVDREIVTLGQSEPKLVGLEGNRMDGQQSPQRRQKATCFSPSHFHLASRDIGDLVQHLNADRAPVAKYGFRTVGLRRVAGGEVNENVAVEEV